MAFSPASATRAVITYGLALAAALAAARPAAARIDFALPGFREEVVAAGLPFATAVAFAADGRLFIALKSGVVRVWRDGVLLPEPFLDLSAQVNDVYDRGLLGLALHPDFPATPYLYLLFTRDPPGVAADGAGARVARLVRVEADPRADHDVALPGMDQAQNPSCLAAPPPGGCPGHVVLLGRNSLRPYIGDEYDGRNTARASCMAGGSMGTLPLALPGDDPEEPWPAGTSRPIEDCSPADARTHTIGTVAFGSDGALFVSAGDGAEFSEVDPRALRALLPDSLAGKILRIDATTGAGLPDNPFFDPACPGCNRSKVWALGLRNPFRFAIDPATGEPVVGDVGWNTWEEVNRGRGANFGWPCYEGAPATGFEGGATVSAPQPGYAASTATAFACAQLFARGADAVRAPVFAYGHEADGFGGSGGASVNAGAFYRGDAYPPELHGALFLLDYSRRWIRALVFDPAGAARVVNVGRETTSGMVQVIEGPGGDLHVVVFSAAGGEVRRLRYEPGTTPPVAIAAAAPNAGRAPLTVQFDAAASFDPDGGALAFAWEFGDGATSTAARPTHTYATPGDYVATLTVRETAPPHATAQATVVVFSGTEAPTATIAAPAPGRTYRIGDRIAFSGGGTIDGSAAPPERLAWQLRLQHNEHVHFTSLGSGSAGSFVVEEHGDATALELCLTVATNASLAATRCVALRPETARLTVDSEPPGMGVVYEDEGVLLTTPAEVAPIVGSRQRLTVPFVQNFLTFAGWADGDEAASREVAIDAGPIGLRALFANRPPRPRAAVVPVRGVAPLAVAATAAGSSDPEAGPLAVQWDFGGEAAARTSRAGHTFALPGSHAVQLAVVDPPGARATDVVVVTVEPPACACAAGEADDDGDGVCDRVDRCTAAAGLERLRLALRERAEGRERRLRLRALLVQPGFDPVRDGLQLRVDDPCGRPLAAVVLAAGDGWLALRSGWVWRGVDAGSGRLRVVVQPESGRAGSWRIRLDAARLPAGAGVAAIPAAVVVAGAGGCAEAAPAGSAQALGCRSRGGGREVRCEPPR